MKTLSELKSKMELLNRRLKIIWSKITCNLTVVVTVALIIVLIVLIFMKPKIVQEHLKSDLKSNNLNSNNIIIDVLDGPQPPPNSIFFIDTTHLLGLDHVIDLELTSRKACALESTSKFHPNLSIYVLFTTPVRYSNKLLNSNSVKQNPTRIVYDLPNVFIRYLNIERFVEGTVLKSFFKSGKFNESLYPAPHLSDVLRVAVMRRYGGMYLDLDVVTLKSFYDLGRNYIPLDCKDNDNELNSGVLNFELKGIGLEILDGALEEIAHNFNGAYWAVNGPLLLTRVVKKVCHTKHLKTTMKSDGCRGYRTLPHWSFFPYDWDQAILMFDELYNRTRALQDVANSYSLHLYGHTYNAISILKNESNNLLTHLAAQHCPVSYFNSGDYF